MLQAIHDALSSSFMRHGFPVLDESAKSWLEEGEEPHDFKAWTMCRAIVGCVEKKGEK